MRNQDNTPGKPSPDLQNGLPPGPRRRVMTGILLAIALANLDTAIANTALPTIASRLGVDAGAAVWVVTIYQLALVATLLPLASMGEIVGQRRVHLGGLMLFTAASLACATAWSLASLIAARILQGLGASAIMAANVALIRSVYPPDQLGRGIGLNALVVGTAFVLGPTIASAILAVAPWPWLFAVNVPIGIAALALAGMTLPETVRVHRRFDWLAAILTGGIFALFVLGLGEAAHAGPWLRIAPEWAGALVCGVCLLRRQAGHEAPMLAADLLRRRPFALSAATGVCTFAAQGLAFVSLPFHFQHDLGYTQVQTGFLITPWPIVVAVIGPLAGRLSDRYPAGLLGGIGLGALAGGMALLALLPPAPAVPDVIWRMALCGAGFGFFQAPNVHAMMGSAPPNRSGGASGMASLVRLLGQTTGAALVAACFAVAGAHGPTLALVLGSAFAAAAAVASLLRLTSRPASTPSQAGCSGA